MQISKIIFRTLNVIQQPILHMSTVVCNHLSQFFQSLLDDRKYLHLRMSCQSSRGHRSSSIAFLRPIHCSFVSLLDNFVLVFNEVKFISGSESVEESLSFFAESKDVLLLDRGRRGTDDNCWSPIDKDEAGRVSVDGVLLVGRILGVVWLLETARIGRRGDQCSLIMTPADEDESDVFIVSPLTGRRSASENVLLLVIVTLLCGEGNNCSCNDEVETESMFLSWAFLLEFGDNSPVKFDRRCSICSLCLRNIFSSEFHSFWRSRASFFNAAASCAFRKSKVFALFLDSKISSLLGFILVRSWRRKTLHCTPLTSDHSF